MTMQGAVRFAEHATRGHGPSRVGFNCAVTRPSRTYYRFSRQILSASDSASAFATGVQGAVPPPAG
jgi:hypothetical protein